MSDPPRQIYTSVKSRRDLVEYPRARRAALGSLIIVSIAVVIIGVVSLI